eukprot:3044840-Pleurochrysis_carterae.AAC.3
MRDWVKGQRASGKAYGRARDALNGNVRRPFPAPLIIQDSRSGEACLASLFDFMRLLGGHQTGWNPALGGGTAGAEARSVSSA